MPIITYMHVTFSTRLCTRYFFWCPAYRWNVKPVCAAFIQSSMSVVAMLLIEYKNDFSLCIPAAVSCPASRLVLAFPPKTKAYRALFARVSSACVHAPAGFIVLKRYWASFEFESGFQMALNLSSQKFIYLYLKMRRRPWKVWNLAQELKCPMELTAAAIMFTVANRTGYFWGTIYW